MSAAGSVELIGYSDRLSVAGGESIGFHVSSRLPNYEATLVRLIHGDTRPGGPGFKEVELTSSFGGEYAGTEFGLRNGSYVRIDDAEPLNLSGSFLLEAWVWPTALEVGAQAIMAKGDAYGLWIGQAGDLELRLGGRHLGTGTPLRANTWYRVAAEVDPIAGTARLIQEPQRAWPGLRPAEAHVDGIEAPDASEMPLLLAACGANDGARAHFNGKIDAPRIALIRDSGEKPVAGLDW